MAYQSVNPFSGEKSQSFAELSDAALEERLARAHECYRADWRKRSIAERSSIAGKVAARMRERKEELARLLTVEMGKRISEARWEVGLSADIFGYYAEHAAAFLEPRQLEIQTGSAQVESEPLGILFGVEPWNFPYYQLARFAAPNLVAGNVLLVKHASIVPQCALAFEKVLRDAGVPDGAYGNLFISKKQIEVIIADPRIQGVALTGSEEAGQSVAKLAGASLKKSTMELGGSDAFIVLDDADLGLAVKMAVAGRFGNAGQSCVAAKRFIVVEPVAKAFLEAFTAQVEALVSGDPLDEATTLAPLSSVGALEHLLEQVNKAIKGGARVVCGGKRLDRPGAFMSPTILTNITRGNPVFHEELFGPVALFFVVPDEQAAIALANDSPFGLGGSVFCRDLERAARVARQIETGMVFINETTSTAPELPFGGVKNSGYGRELSELGISEFLNKKLIRTGATKRATQAHAGG